jgi:hypothetical protein
MTLNTNTLNTNILMLITNVKGSIFYLLRVLLITCFEDQVLTFKFFWRAARINWFILLRFGLTGKDGGAHVWK